MMVNKISGKDSITHYKVLEYFSDKDLSLIECTLETGRTHQIRVHMSHIGHSILGDQLLTNVKQDIHLMNKFDLLSLIEKDLINE